MLVCKLQCWKLLWSVNLLICQVQNLVIYGLIYVLKIFTKKFKNLTVLHRNLFTSIFLCPKDPEIDQVTARPKSTTLCTLYSVGSTGVNSNLEHDLQSLSQEFTIRIRYNKFIHFCFISTAQFEDCEENSVFETGKQESHYSNF